MSSQAARAGAGGEGEALDAVEAELLEAAVERALDPYRATLGADDLAWMRACLIEGAREESSLARLARAAAPRDVDQSGEVVRARRTTGR